MFDYNMINWKLFGDKTHIEFLKCIFKIRENTRFITVDILDFSCNMTDINCKRDDVYGENLNIAFDKEFNSDRINQIEVLEDDLALNIDGQIYTIDKDSCDIQYFLGDFSADIDIALKSLLHCFANSIRNYNY